MKFLRFEEKTFKGRTKKFDVYSVHSDDYLGEIKWYNGWRRYVIHFDRGTIWSAECLREGYCFIQNLMNVHKQNSVTVCT